jgi:predicted porin
MKKSGLTLAALSLLAGGAHAQSSVVLYGRTDANYTYQKPAVGDAIHKMNDGSVNGVGGSRFGVRGNEDLGSGLKAYFVLEAAVSLDNGGTSTDGLFWNRQAYAAIGSSSFGDIRLGRQQTLTREFHNAVTDITAESEMNVVETLATGRTLFQNFGARVSNAVQYLSPTFGGVQLRAMVAAGEGATSRQQGASLLYASGPLKAGVAYEAYDSGTAGTYNEVITLGAQYNFGVLTLSGGYEIATDLGTNLAPTGGGGTDQNSYNIGLLVPVGALELRFQYIHSTVETATTKLDQSKVGISGRYNLSKRTQVYAAVTQRDGDNDSGFTRKNEYIVGLGHNF